MDLHDRESEKYRRIDNNTDIPEHVSRNVERSSDMLARILRMPILLIIWVRRETKHTRQYIAPATLNESQIYSGFYHQPGHDRTRVTAVILEDSAKCRTPKLI